MATVLDTFITKFRYENDKKGLEEATRGITNFKNTILKAGAIILSVISGGAFVGHIAASVDEMGKFAESIGITVEQLQALDFAAKRSGVSTNTLHASLQSLNKVLGEASRGYGNYAQVLGRFGVDIRKNNGDLLNSYELLKQLNAVFQTLTTTQQFDLAQNIGLSPDTIKMLQRTPKEFDALLAKSKALGQVTTANTKAAAKFEDSLTDMKTAFFALSAQLSNSTYPILEKLLSWMTAFIEFLQRNPGLVYSIGIAIGVLTTAFVSMRIAAIAAWAAAFAPVTAAIAVITGLVLVIQDLWVAFKGGDSVLGGFIKKSQTIQKIWHEITKGFEAASRAYQSFLNFSKRNFNKIAHPDSLQLSGIPFRVPISHAAPASAGTSNKSVAINVGGITIHVPSGNPTDIANVVDDHLKNQLKNSVVHFDSEIAK
jgi:hypothetical protein